MIEAGKPAAGHGRRAPGRPARRAPRPLRSLRPHAALRPLRSLRPHGASHPSPAPRRHLNVFAQRQVIPIAKPAPRPARDPALPPDPGRQPRRDRAAHHPGRPRARDGGGRRLLRRRRRRGARAGGRQRRPARPGAARRQLPADRRVIAAAVDVRRGGDPSGVRLPVRAGGVRPGRRGRRARLRRPAGGRDRGPRRQAGGPPDGARRRHPARARDARAGAGRSTGSAGGAPRGRQGHRLPAPRQGGRRRRRSGDAARRRRGRAAGGR